MTWVGALVIWIPFMGCCYYAGYLFDDWIDRKEK
jgi:hypothetical protein